MARGLPAVWSSLLGLPFVAAGAYLYLGQTDVPPELGIPSTLFGVFVFAVGLYVHFVAAPEAPRMRDGESLLETRHPTQRVATVKVVVGFLVLVVTGYLLLGTVVPYVYPTLTLVVGLYLFSTGLQTYWSNSITTYYLTNQRVITEYRLISLSRRELPLDKLRGVEERKSVIESFVGLGNVRVASGGGGGALEIVMQNMERSTEFADRVRELL
jgi:hypothetical protein